MKKIKNRICQILLLPFVLLMLISLFFVAAIEYVFGYNDSGRWVKDFLRRLK